MCVGADVNFTHTQTHIHNNRSLQHSSLDEEVMLHWNAPPIHSADLLWNSRIFLKKIVSVSLRARILRLPLPITDILITDIPITGMATITDRPPSQTLTTNY